MRVLDGEQFLVRILVGEEEKWHHVPLHRALLERLFTPSEIAYCERHRNRAERFAGRFAAKEAAMKALGTGWARGVRWVDIEVVREPSGKPTLKLSGATRAIADQLGVKNIAVTITHDGNTALAQVIFES